MSAPRVLVIVPDSDTREALRDVLDDCGAPVDMVAGPEEAIRWVAGGGVPCVVIIDPTPHQLPEARAFVSSLRRSTATVDVPVITLRGFPLQPFDDRTMVIDKPFQLETLRSLVCASAVRCN